MHHESASGVEGGARCRGCPVALTDDELPGGEDDYDGFCVRCAESVLWDPWARGTQERRPVDVDGPALGSGRSGDGFDLAARGTRSGDTGVSGDERQTVGLGGSDVRGVIGAQV